MPSSQQQTGTAVPSEAKSSGGSGTNVAGIAAGVVVGVVALAGIAIGLFFFMRHRKRKTEEEEFKRTQVGDFMRHGGTSGEGKPPNTGYSNMSDSRLDPEANKRNSIGSIADGQDYSRRILRVRTNVKPHVPRMPY
jgi:cell wall integrity and stress response component